MKTVGTILFILIGLYMMYLDYKHTDPNGDRFLVGGMIVGVSLFYIYLIYTL